ncbi:MAG: 4Fe-4S dicluster domain-containing protein [Helicobacteraceae bacterium]|jgi:Fe-S-cluster-containing dehydrogenase component|nr:4Fe-4S dicluster domain-containing protein [Helicobacteraceae bacterium]
MNRRRFFKTAAVLGAGAALALAKIKAADKQDDQSKIGSIIDLTLCDGCADRQTPACVAACREKNADKFPQPDPKYLIDYFPQKKREDWSNKRGVTTRLTPYNWTYVESVEIEGQKVFLPRRCMHCDDPACQKLCPFGVIGKSKEGAVSIDADFCMGGSKCRDVCPWHIPQRQAGVGIYTKVAPKLMGGGVMFKCDLCADYLAKDKTPACAEKCPKKAIIFGEKEVMRNEARRRAKALGGYLYGDNEAGGTATFYVSKIPFERIDKAIAAKKGEDKAPGRPQIPVGVANPLGNANGLFAAALIAPVAALTAAAISVYKGGKDD